VLIILLLFLALACERFKTQFPLQVDPHILGGTAVEEGEYPHMAALGYPVQGNESQYSFRCGGSLIDPLYVLTAAHCVYSPENQPEIVRLGTVDLDHSTHAVDIKIAVSMPRLQKKVCLYNQR